MTKKKATVERGIRGAPPVTPPKEVKEPVAVTAKEDRKHARRTTSTSDDRRQLITLAYRFTRRTLTAEELVEELATLLARPTTNKPTRQTEVTNPDVERFRELQTLAAGMAMRLQIISRDKLPLAREILRARRKVEKQIAGASR